MISFSIFIIKCISNSKYPKWPNLYAGNWKIFHFYVKFIYMFSGYFTNLKWVRYKKSLVSGKILGDSERNEVKRRISWSNSIFTGQQWWEIIKIKCNFSQIINYGLSAKTCLPAGRSAYLICKICVNPYIN